MNKLQGWKGIGVIAGFVAALVALSVIVRLAVDGGMLPYNFAAVGAAAMFAGFMLRSRAWALAVPVLAMLVSNALIGGYSLGVMVLVYAALVLPVFLGRWIVRRESKGVALAAWLGGGSVVSALAFYILTNGAVWAFTPWYETTLSGLIRCYVAALPFFKWTLASNLLFTGLFFGAWALVSQASRVPVRSLALVR